MARTRTPSKNSWLYAVIPAAALALFVAGTIGHGIAHDNSQQTINTLSDKNNRLTADNGALVQELGALETKNKALVDSLNVAKQRLQECIDGKKDCKCKTKGKTTSKKKKSAKKTKTDTNTGTTGNANTSAAGNASAAAAATASNPAKTPSAATATATSATATTATQQNANVDADNNSGIIVVGNGNAVNVTNVVQEAEKAAQEQKYKCIVMHARVKRR